MSAAHSLHGYSQGCRCGICAHSVVAEAARIQHNRRIDREPPSHGSNSIYVNWSCRCGSCTEAHRIYERGRRLHRRSQLKASA
jgi:hypothetical protein